MPYTPPSQRSPAASAPNSPSLSRRGSYQPGQISGPPASSRPELPRSTSYLTRHRRTPSVKTSALVPTPETTPPSTADNEKNNDASSLTAHGTLRQSPPPVTDESQMPAGAVISPPESSDDEDRGLEKLAELQRAIRIIEQHRESSPTRTAAEVEKTAQALHLVVPDELSAKPIEQLLEFPKGVHKIAHNRSNTDSSVFVRLGGEMPSASETPLTGSDLDDSDSEESGRSGRKPPMLRKKSGELVRPALRPSSARRRPSSMPGTPTFSKAVHFDSHLEHVRHFLQVDRPLAVSAGSSPVEAYDSDTEFPFGEDDNNGRSPPFEWEIVVANFPAETPKRLAMPVRVERVFLSSDNKTLIGSIAVANLAFNKWVVARFTLDYWKTTSEVVAEYNHDVRQQKSADGYDRFNFNIRLADQANLEAKTMFFCVKYCVNGQEHWDNNNNTNFQVDFKKKYKPQNGKRGMQGNNSKPVHHSLPRSQKSSPPASAGNKPKMAAFDSAFDDFGDGFDPKYKFVNTKEAMKDFLAEPDRTVRLKGSQSAVHLGSDNLTRRVQTSGQAFGNRYDFGASLNAAIAAANRELGDRSGITMKSNMKKKQQQQQQKQITDAPVTESPISAGPAGFNKAATSSKGAIQMAPSASGTDSPRTVADKAVLGSQSYNEILDKYCFFGSSKNSPKNSPQVKEGTLKSGQYDGSNDDGYVLGSTESSVDSSSNNSPLMMQSVKNQSSPPRPQQQSTQASRSASPAPMTGFVSGTSMYPYHMHHGFPFNEAHVATAIRG